MHSHDLLPSIHFARRLNNPDVPHISCVQGEDETWEKSLLVWLEGKVFIHGARNMIHKCFFVAQMKPDFIPEANKNDEDIFYDEHIGRERTDVQTLLHTHCGVTRHDNEDDNTEEKVTHVHSKDAMRRANRMLAEYEKKEGRWKLYNRHTTIA